MLRFILLLLVATAQGFAPTTLSRPASSLSSQADSMAGKSVELGGGVWDPLGLADLGSERTLRWFRAAEVKHCRVAMLATLGWAHTCNGWSKIVYPGGENLGTDPWKALENTPSLGLLQILITAGIIEILTESVLTNGSHYLNSGDGHVNPMMFSNVPDKMKDKELKNGRLAMIGIFSFFFASAVPGSVPLYPAEWL
ncbi:hypothetical protein TrVE_jg3680 [Triparma verrucosa]|uniref:Chlorophyll a-b binding protein, chloroplastic n=2 Tax=Triparma TaxID=722752 RepID=A0A9W7F0I3_9STRA|nr:hypothetical protein TrST_g12863 [Triparma strigata]GMI14122.1 hypothetical protein TrVE_jg3680 [Triparma verrucosa]